ncbi:hypothetical protein NUW58_g2358 [Xylaria curta]|uniref:Uncharacterized protein n=1 Tax=Xylaria curta TaxID=42375 RepID=A0ACC1PH54_9PEZI|nr:hypothetical protein NUW58_g2358 [Xylaria curta]
MPPTVHIQSYRLRQDTLKEYLEKVFPGVTIKITNGEDTYDVTLPKELTQVLQYVHQAWSITDSLICATRSIMTILTIYEKKGEVQIEGA